MNSLYGKFAQRIDEETIYIRNVEKEMDFIQECQRKNKFIKLQMFNHERLDAFLIKKSSKNINLSYSIPSFASYITSFSRVHLLKKLLQLKNNGVVYCDTDSVFFEIDTSDADSKELGGWKIEAKIITEIRGLKNYKYIDPQTLKEKLRLKGVPKNAVQTSENSFEYTNLMKPKEALRRNRDSGVLTKRTKTILGLYTKRIVLPDGNTKPIIL